MPKFIYVAKNKTGQTVKGNVEASDKKAAMNVLREKSLLILKLEKDKGKSLLFSFSSSSRIQRIKLEELVVFTRQMTTLTSAGITIVSALDTLAEQSENPTFSKYLWEIKEAVNTGASLSEAMGKYSKVFSEYFVNMVRAGESSGMLDEVLERVATYLEKTNALQKKIKSAMIYPFIVSLMAIIITLVMIIKVIPVFKDMFSSFGAALPGPTQFLINLSDGVRESFLLYMVLIGIFTVAIKWYASTPKGKLVVDMLKLRAPVFGTLLKKVAVSKFTRTLSTLVKSGVPILSALEIVSKTSGNRVIELEISKVRVSVQEGESIATPLEKSGIFPPLVTKMISVGEKSGELENMLSKISDFYDEQVDTAVDGLTSLIEPLIIAFLGIVIGGIVLCMFLPIFKMSSLISM